MREQRSSARNCQGADRRRTPSAHVPSRRASPRLFWRSEPRKCRTAQAVVATVPQPLPRTPGRTESAHLLTLASDVEAEPSADRIPRRVERLCDYERCDRRDPVAQRPPLTTQLVDASRRHSDRHGELVLRDPEPLDEVPPSGSLPSGWARSDRPQR